MFDTANAGLTRNQRNNSVVSCAGALWPGHRIFVGLFFSCRQSAQTAKSLLKRYQSGKGVLRLQQ
jgi:hypothetical protein